jgi:hypothetical protein
MEQIYSDELIDSCGAYRLYEYDFPTCRNGGARFAAQEGGTMSRWCANQQAGYAQRERDYYCFHFFHCSLFSVTLILYCMVFHHAVHIYSKRYYIKRVTKVNRQIYGLFGPLIAGKKDL